MGRSQTPLLRTRTWRYHYVCILVFWYMLAWPRVITLMSSKVMHAMAEDERLSWCASARLCLQYLQNMRALLFLIVASNDEPLNCKYVWLVCPGCIWVALGAKVHAACSISTNLRAFNARSAPGKMAKMLSQFPTCICLS